MIIRVGKCRTCLLHVIELADEPIHEHRDIDWVEEFSNSINSITPDRP